jgi:hypothetical protein
MVFDDWQNGCPIVFIIISRSKQTDLALWMKALRDRMLSAQPDWLPNAFIVDDAQAEINTIRYRGHFSTFRYCNTGAVFGFRGLRFSCCLYLPRTFVNRASFADPCGPTRPSFSVCGTFVACGRRMPARRSKVWRFGLGFSKQSDHSCTCPNHHTRTSRWASARYGRLPGRFVQTVQTKYKLYKLYKTHNVQYSSTDLQHHRLLDTSSGFRFECHTEGDDWSILYKMYK